MPGLFLPLRRTTKMGVVIVLAVSIAVGGCSDETEGSGDAGPADSGASDAATLDGGQTLDATLTLDGSTTDGGDGSDSSTDGGLCSPVCAADNVCLGEACSCIQEIDGDSYLRANGTVVYYRNATQVVAETAPGVPLTGLIELFDGWRHSCGLRDDGTVWCWAKATTGNDFGALGIGTIGGATTAMRASQVMLPPDGPGGVATPLEGMAHLNGVSDSRCYIASTTCAIRETDGALFCWGADNSAGGAGSFYTDGVVGVRPYATQIFASDGVPFTDVAEVALGLRHACALTTGREIRCWGVNVGGPLGQGDQTLRQYPTTVTLPGGAMADEIGAGGDFSCARSGGNVYCWGSSGRGQIGIGDPTSMENHDGCINFCHLTPAQVIDETDAPLSGVNKLEVVYQGACAIHSDDSLHCWGASLGEVATPMMVGGEPVTNVAQVTSCSSDPLPMSIRTLGRDAVLSRVSVEVSPECL